MFMHRLPFGPGYVDIDLSRAVARQIEVHTIAPCPAAPAADPVAEVEAALAAAALPAYRGGGCAIAVNDRTRPVPHDVLLPPLLRFLERAGVAADDILLVIATGTHAPMEPPQFTEVIPPAILGRSRVVCHDAHDEARLVRLGDTSRGTPIEINRDYFRRELHAVVGAIEPHQFVGFSGGAKSAAVGLGGYATVTHNHSMMVLPGARIGRYEDNPCRQDIEEIGQRIGVHFALNVVLGADKRIVRAFAGPPEDVMRQGIPHVRQSNQVTVERPFDLVVASPGGHPKDVNLYQAQKALAHAALVTRPGGTVIVAAACPDGAGSQAYEQWISEPGMVSHAAVLERFAREGYRIGPHKAFMISRDATACRVLLNSRMTPELAGRLLLTPAPDLQRSVDEAVAALAPGSRIAVMPFANATIPVLAADPA